MEKKVIILDFDGTLYSGENVFSFVPEYVDKHRRSFFSKVSDKDYEMILRENPSLLDAVSGSEIVKCMYQIKNRYPMLTIDISDFTNCQEANVYDINLSKAHFVDIDFITKLCSEYPVYVVSNSAINHIRHYMKVLGINPEIFKEIFSNQFEEFDQTKKHYYFDILTREQVEPSNLYVFGDSLNSDLKPATELGANTFLSKDASALETLIYDSLK